MPQKDKSKERKWNYVGMITFVIESFLFDARESVRLYVVFAFFAHSSY